MTQFDLNQCLKKEFLVLLHTEWLQSNYKRHEVKVIPYCINFFISFANENIFYQGRYIVIETV